MSVLRPAEAGGGAGGCSSAATGARAAAAATALVFLRYALRHLESVSLSRTALLGFQPVSPTVARHCGASECVCLGQVLLLPTLKCDAKR